MGREMRMAYEQKTALDVCITYIYLVKKDYGTEDVK